jgi:hypothetical protein
MTKKDYDHYNSAPKDLKVISKDEWRDIMFEFQTGPKESRQVRDGGPTYEDGGTFFDLIMFDIPNPWVKKIGVAVMYDWYNAWQKRNRPKAITRFCRYGSEEDWRMFRNKFNAQFARDNS